MKLFANIKEGWGSSGIGITALVFLAYWLWIDPKAFSFGEIAGVLIGSGCLLGAPPLSKLFPGPK